MAATKKSVYSLVLMDEVVDAVDRLACSLGTSRSNLVNQILAEHLSCETPEMRMKQIFDEMGQAMEQLESFHVQLMASDAMLSIRSPLAYKYKPTIRYGVELYRSADPFLGELRVSLRTQSRPLIEAVLGFYRLFIQLEERYIGRYLPNEQIYTITADGKFARKLLTPENRDSEAVARALTGYIQLFDHLLKLYFSNLEDSELAAHRIQAAYTAALRDGMTIV